MAIVIGTGSFLLFFSLAVNAIALLVPYWVEDTNMAGRSTSGLWGRCKCSWYYHDVEDSDKPSWYQASQWLYAVGVAIMGVAMLTLFIVSCCSKKSYGKAMVAAGALMLVAATLIGVSVVLFGVKGHDEEGYDLDSTPKLIWGMWLACAGFGIALITGIVFLVQGTRISAPPTA